MSVFVLCKTSGLKFSEFLPIYSLKSHGLKRVTENCRVKNCKKPLKFVYKCDII